MNAAHDERHFETHIVSSPRRLSSKFVVFIGGAIVIAVALVVVAMSLYQQSGAAQLDLSRPIYESVRSKTQRPEKLDGFASSGELDDASLNQFKELYQKAAEDVEKQSSGFNARSLDNSSLLIDLQ